MKNDKKIWIVGLAAILAIGMVAGNVLGFSGGSGNDPDGDPPNGLAISSDAPGTKLVGVLAIEYINWHKENSKDIADVARVVLRLRKGNILRTFHDEVPGPLWPVDDVLGTQQLIMEKMMDTVLEAFFPDKSGLEAKVKLMVNWDTVPGGTFVNRDSILPGYGTCTIETVCIYDDDPKNIDPDGEDERCDNPPEGWIDILTCDGNFELCGNSLDPEQMPIDDDGDWKPDGHGPLAGQPFDDTDCLHRSHYVISDIDLAVK